jgi:hypothetical protein
MSVLSEFATGLIAPIAGIVSEFVEDKDKANELTYKIASEAGERESAERLGQMAINKEDAKSGKWWQAGWRPFFGWMCGLAFANNFIIMPYAMAISSAITPMDWAAMSPVVLGMLGLATQRTVERVKGKA